MKLEQKRLWDNREFTLLEKELLIRMTSPTEEIELKFKYEDLGFETAFVRKKTVTLVLSISLVLTTIIGGMILVNLNNPLSTFETIAVAGLTAFVYIAVFLISYDNRKPQIVVKGGKESFTLLADSPSREKVDEFIKVLQERMTQRIIDLEIRPNDPKMEYATQKEALENLLDNEIISRDKFEEMIKLLKEKQKSKPAIGF